MKAILISIHSQWVELILNHIKKDEIRKGTAIGKAINKLIAEQGVAPMLIYCTKGNKSKYNRELLRKYENVYLIDKINYKTFNQPLNGKVVARFNATADKILCFIESQDSYSGNDAIYEYSAGEYSSMILRERSCLTYEEMLDYLREVEGECGTAIHINDLEIFDKPKEISEFWHETKTRDNVKGYVCSNERLTRAPESWCYVEV